mgnify:CR=1 FL=1
MRILASLWLLAVVVSLDACAQTPLTKETSLIRVPMGIGYGISDVVCEEVKNTSIPKKLKDLEIPFEWTDKNDGLLSVGPLTEESEGVHSTIRQTYFLNITCSDELTTSITGEAILEGLNASGQWVGITDSTTIEHYGMQFLQRLDL